MTHDQIQTKARRMGRAKLAAWHTKQVLRRNARGAEVARILKIELDRRVPR